jgi:phage RecT family recombinase
MTDSQLAILESNLTPLMPSLAEVLPDNMPAERITRTVLVACEQNPYLLQTKFRSSLLQSAMSAAVLGLEVDGLTGQGYLVPFKNKAQFLTGYKGFVTIAARASRTIDGFIVREGDGFEFDEPSGEVTHKRQLGNESNRQIIAAYAISRGINQPTLLRVMSIDEVMEVRDSSAGWKDYQKKKKAGERGFSVWATDPAPMIRKTPIRRLSNNIPVLAMQMAGALDTQHDLGRFAHIRSDRTIVTEDGVEVELAGNAPEQPVKPEVHVSEPGAYKVIEPDSERSFKDFMGYYSHVTRLFDRMTPEQTKAFAKLNRKYIEALIDSPHSKEASRLIDRINAV